MTYLAKVVALKVRSATLNLIPHALHVVQVVGLVPILGEHGSRLLSLLYLPRPELPLGCLTVQEPASKHHKRGRQFGVSCVCAKVVQRR